MARKFALIIGSSQYDDPALARLRTPEADILTLAAVLRDPQIGNFDDVKELMNESETSIRRAISTFFAQKKPDDLLLFYFSGHGVLDDRGRLFLAVKDTQHQLLKATAISSSFILDEMDESRSRRQLLILDCCHSGAFSSLSKGVTKAVTQATFEGNGYGRMVLAASDSTQVALEAGESAEKAPLSLFTNFLIQGLVTGEADLGGDGWVAVDEWYDYAFERVLAQTPGQTPRKWVYNQEGELLVARNPHPGLMKPADFPMELKQGLLDPQAEERLKALSVLSQLLQKSQAMTTTAQDMLAQIKAHDKNPKVRELAGAIMAESAGLPADQDLRPEQPSGIAEKRPAWPRWAWLAGIGGVALLGMLFAAVLGLFQPASNNTNPPTLNSGPSASNGSPTKIPVIFGLIPTATLFSPVVAPSNPSIILTATSGSSDLDRALAGEFRGKKVIGFGPQTSNSEQIFMNTMKDFIDRTGIEFQYDSVQDIPGALANRIRTGDVPDIVDFPQPGLLKSYAASGSVIDLNSFMDPKALQANYNQSWLNMATMPGKDGKPVMAGVWERSNGKSIVFYPKKAFDQAGYKIPTTWDELMALTDQIARTGSKPWCISMESSAATGWVATDWIEDILLRTTSPENYDRWVNGQLKFQSPEVKNAADIMAKIWLNPQYVYGGIKTIVTTPFYLASDPMFQDPPGCWLMKQGNFFTYFFPTEAKMGIDYGLFYLPPIDLSYGRPFLVGGDIWGMFRDRPEVRAVMEYFTKGEHLKSWMMAGGVIAPQNDADPNWYGSGVDRSVAKIMQDATTLRFDGSDQMPSRVGDGTFWSAMTDWISGKIDEMTALKQIDDSWPK